MGDTTASIRAAQLIKKNPQWWERFFVRPALEEASAGRRVSIQRLVELARNKDYAESTVSR